MSVYLINGPSGSGKTSIGAELQERGFRVIDTDEKFGYYANLETEEPAEFQHKNVTEDWYKHHGWIWDKQKVEEVINNATETTFFCGGSLNESIFYPRFNRIFRLIVTPETLVARIKKRGNDKHTNNPVFIARMLKFLETAKADGEKSGMVVIDTSAKTVSESTDELLSYVNE